LQTTFFIPYLQKTISVDFGSIRKILIGPDVTPMRDVCDSDALSFCLARQFDGGDLQRPVEFDSRSHGLPVDGSICALDQMLIFIALHQSASAAASATMPMLPL